MEYKLESASTSNSFDTIDANDLLDISESNLVKIYNSVCTKHSNMLTDTLYDNMGYIYLRHVDNKEKTSLITETNDQNYKKYKYLYKIGRSGNVTSRLKTKQFGDIKFTIPSRNQLKMETFLVNRLKNKYTQLLNHIEFFWINDVTTLFKYVFLWSFEFEYLHNSIHCNNIIDFNLPENPIVPSEQNSTLIPIQNPTFTPIHNPILTPIQNPILTPIQNPALTSIQNPTFTPIQNPTLTSIQNPIPTTNKNPTLTPIQNPTLTLIQNPTFTPIQNPTFTPIQNPTFNPIKNPTFTPIHNPILTPIQNPTLTSIQNLTFNPIKNPTFTPIKNPIPTTNKNLTLTPTTNLMLTDIQNSIAEQNHDLTNKELLQPYICPICPTKYSSSVNYKKHLENHINKNESINIAIDAKSQLESDIKNHRYKFECRFCNEKLSCQNTLDKHINNSCVYKITLDYVNKCNDNKILHEIYTLVTYKLTKHITFNSVINDTTDPLVTDQVVTDPVVTDPVVTDTVLTDAVLTDTVLTDTVLTNIDITPINIIHSISFENISYLVGYFQQNTNDIQNMVLELGNYVYSHDNYNYKPYCKLDYPFKHFIDLFEKIHIIIHHNPDHPENHNIHITNKKSYMPYRFFSDSWKIDKNLALFKDVIIVDIFEAIMDTLIILHGSTLDLTNPIKNIKKIYLNFTDNLKRDLGNNLWLISYNHNKITECSYKNTQYVINKFSKNFIKTRKIYNF
jgi:hypothetical protein